MENREKVKIVANFILESSKITADGDSSHEIKTHLFLGGKAKTTYAVYQKVRDIILPAKVRLVKAVVFLVVVYQCDSWTIKQAEN